MDWDSSVDRGRLIDRVGVEEYNRMFEEHKRQSTVAVVGGHGIRPIGTSFGKIFIVGDTGVGYKTLEQAKAYALEHPAI